ncbi:MAG: TolC family protein, partial [Gemmatimonadaceae bacterium]
MFASSATAQRPAMADAPRAISRQDAIAATLAQGARLALARAEASAAEASFFSARIIPNPSITTEYTKSAPQRHVTLDWPLDLPWLRSRRIGAASEVRSAARYRLAFERAAAELDADTAYTQALAARARARLSEANAAAGDTLLLMARSRQRAGDVSELEVKLAEVFAGQQANMAAADSEALDSRLLDLQAAMGLASDAVAISLADSLGDPPVDVPGAGAGTPLLVAAAERMERGAELSVRLERANVWQIPSFIAGFETHDPSGGEPGILPTIGLSIPLPLGNRNRGGIALAEAERERARAGLALARVEARIELVRARRERDGALGRLTRDRALLASAERVAAMSLIAYREGAAALPNVLEAQRNAREVMAQYL